MQSRSVKATCCRENERSCELFHVAQCNPSHKCRRGPPRRTWAQNGSPFKVIREGPLLPERWRGNIGELLAYHQIVDVPKQETPHAQVDLHPESYQIRRESPSQTGAELLQHVPILISLHFHSLQSSHGDYFGSFHHLERLVFRQFVHIEPNITILSSGFQTTLSFLSLGRVCLTWDAFTNVVDYFPDLTSPHPRQSSLAGDYRTVTPLSRSPRGKLRLFAFILDDMANLSSGISASELRSDELEFVNVIDQTPSHIHPIISVCSNTPMCLALDPCGCKFQYRATCSDAMQSTPSNLNSIQHVTLEECLELRELVFIALWPTLKENPLILSITSMNIQKFVFVPRDACIT